MNVDIALRNGRILDPATGRDEIADLHIAGGRVIALQPGEKHTALYEIDASGLLIVPGLIDFHAHIYHGGTDIGVPADTAMLPSGVTTVVDAGSAGFSTYRAFRASLAQSVVRTRAYLNICPTGLGTMQFHEDVNPKFIDAARIRETLEESDGHLLGLKLRLSRGVVGDLGLAPLEAVLKLAEQLGCPVVVHVTDPPVPAREILSLLRGGDVFCHVFHGTGHTILRTDGSLDLALEDARKRGVLFDAANGGNHFSFSVAEGALNAGFLPDVISTDLTVKTMFRSVVEGLPLVLSKYLALGMPLMDVLRACTATPARIMGLKGQIGSLAPGACADVALLDPRAMPVTFTDTLKAARSGACCLVPMLTLRKGAIVFRNYALR